MRQEEFAQKVRDAEAEAQPHLFAPYYDRQGAVMFTVGGLLVGLDLVVTRVLHETLGEGLLRAGADALFLALTGAAWGLSSAAARAGEDLRLRASLPVRRSWSSVALGAAAGAALSVTVTFLLRR